jgi:hypothetical protein
MCQHKNILDDPVEGCEVCTDCGLVISSSFFVNTHVSAYTVEENSAIKTYLYDLCMLFNVESLSMRECCYKKFVTLSKMLALSNISMKKKHICAFVVYSEVLANCLPVSYSEYFEKTELTPSALRQMEKFMPLHSEKPENFLGLFCYSINLTRKDEVKIRNRLLSSKYTACRPRNIAVAFIYLYCTQCKKNIGLEEICSTLNVNKVSIKRLAILLLKKNPNLEFM